MILTVVSIYGWTNGHNDEGAATKTNDLLEFVLQEFQAWAPGPRCIDGDPDDFLLLPRPLMVVILLIWVQMLVFGDRLQSTC